MARPLVSVGVAVLLLVAASVPYFDLKQGQAGIESLPDERGETAYLIVARTSRRPPAPAEIVIEGQRIDGARPGSTISSPRSGTTGLRSGGTGRSGTRRAIWR